MFMASNQIRKIASSALFITATLLSVSMAFASGDGESAHHVDSAVQMTDFGWRILNFVLLAAILVFAIKKANLKSTLADRQSRIEKELKAAQDGKATAEAKLEEYSVRLNQASKEIDEIHAAIIREGEQEKQRIISEARLAADKIIAQAALSAEQETAKARNELRIEAALLAVEIATGKLSGAIQKNDHDRFVGEYLDKVVQNQ